MRRPVLLVFVVAAVLVVVPGWTGETRLARLGADARIDAAPVPLDPDDPGRRRVGALSFEGAWHLTSPDRAFGGFSAVAVRRLPGGGDRVTLLSDGGNLASLTLARGGRVHDPAFGMLAAGPGTGWEKRDRDAEAMAVAPDGTSWVGFESLPSVFRYAADGRLTGAVRPRAMRDWPVNGGIESLARLPDGRFVAIGERPRDGSRGARPGLIFAGDPTETGRPRRFRYLPPPGTSPSDAAALPDGGLLVLNRGFRRPFRFFATLSYVPPDALRQGAAVTGRPLATLDAPVLHDNWEGVAVTREGADLIVWLVSDDNESILQRTLLARFRLAGTLLDTPKTRRP